MEESSTFRYIVSKGMVQEAKRFLIRQGRKRFGSPDAQTEAAIEAITDVEQLEQLSEQLLDVSSWQELLTPPST
jgi:hypothetical protein